MTWVPAPASLSVMLLTVAARAWTAVARRRPIATAERSPARRPVSLLVSSRILVTLFRFQLDRKRLRFPEGVLNHLDLVLRDAGDVAVQDRISHPQDESPSPAVLHERVLVGRSPHDADEMDVADVDEEAVTGRALVLAVEERLERIAAPAARIEVLLAREEDARVERLGRLLSLRGDDARGPGGGHGARLRNRAGRSRAERRRGGRG